MPTQKKLASYTELYSLTQAEYVKPTKDDNRHMSGWSIIPSPANGHCLLYAIESSWSHQLPNKPAIDIEHIKSLIFLETVKSPDTYAHSIIDKKIYF